MTIPKAIQEKKDRVKKLEKDLAEFELGNTPDNLIEQARYQLELERCKAILGEEKEVLAIAIAAHEKELERQRIEKEEADNAAELERLARAYNDAVNSSRHYLDQLLKFVAEKNLVLGGGAVVQPAPFLRKKVFSAGWTSWDFEFTKRQNEERLAWIKVYGNREAEQARLATAKEAPRQTKFGIIELAHIGSDK